MHLLFISLFSLLAPLLLRFFSEISKLARYKCLLCNDKSLSFQLASPWEPRLDQTSAEKHTFKRTMLPID